MVGFFKKVMLESRQRKITRRYPQVKIILHKDMPISSMNKVVEAARLVSQVNAMEPAIQKLTDEQIRQSAVRLRDTVREKNSGIEAQIEQMRKDYLAVSLPEEKEKIKEKIKYTRNVIFAEILAEGFALVREASRRVIGLRHFDTQIVGGLMLHEGRIAEMATGEGKTLVATLPAFVNALLGKGVHIVTVNDYLARRDREWMGPVFEFLGLTVGVIQHDMSDEERQKEYACDITYGTNNEFGFDYLRDNMKYSLDELVQRPFFFAVVDEVDSILIDEARTPLIISGPAEESTDKYYIIDRIVPKLKGRQILEKDEIDAKYRGEDLSEGYDYMVDEKAHTAYLTEEGEARVCELLKIDNLHDIETMEWRHHVIQALRAHNLYKKDVDYVVKDGQVIIVDEFTGRLMPGRRWSDGLHQAVESKEGMKIERENQTLATITFQNYFRMYEKLSGMTGTAFTEANEFKAIYKLDVVVVPTNRPLIRANYADCIYRTEREKFAAVVEEIAACYKKGRPVLVGTISIDRSEQLSDMLKRQGIPHQVLNAKYHEREAQIVAQAGREKTVTIATNMAGRGTDILLGGNAEFIAKNIVRQKVAAEDPAFQEEYAKIMEKYKKETVEEHARVVTNGGLHVLGTERHEARRIDNQLRGRCGRQGDPGSSRFYVSLEDELMRLFGSQRIATLWSKMGIEEGQVIEHPWISKSIEVAQKRVEQHNFEIRKQLLEYDNVMNKQREVIYSQRRDKLEGKFPKDDIFEIVDAMLDSLMGVYCTAVEGEAPYNIPGLVNAVKLTFGLVVDEQSFAGKSTQEMKQYLYDALTALYNEKEAAISPELMRHLSCIVFLQIIDAKWKDHLYAMDNLREGIGLRAYGQRDPLVEYKKEAFSMFSQMIDTIEDEAVESMFKLHPAKTLERFRGVFSSVAQEYVHPETSQFQPPAAAASEADPAIPQAPAGPAHQPSPAAAHPKVGRNDPCPCGARDPVSGQPIKYKKCHGK